MNLSNVKASPIEGGSTSSIVEGVLSEDGREEDDDRICLPAG